MIQKPNPQYKLTYKQCNNDKNHCGELLNFVCLHDGCQEQSLICSLCRNQKHAGHTTQPLKFYIEQLKKEYQNGARDFDKDFQSLQELRATFLYKLKESVEKIAEEFRKLQEEITEHLDQLKAQLLQEQTKKNKFMDFYESLISEQGEKPEFLIQNYLPKKKLEEIRNMDQLEKLGAKVIKLVQETNQALFNNTQKIKDVTNLLVMPPNIQMKNNIYTQTSTANGSKSLIGLKVDLLKQFGNGKIKIKVMKLKKGSNIYMGAIQKIYFDSLNFATPHWNTHGKIFYINNKGAVLGQSKSHIAAFSENSNFQITMDGQTLKVAMKKNSSQFNLPNNGHSFYFFICLIGQTELELNYIA